MSDTDRSGPTAAPIALDGLVYGIDLLDAVLVFHLGDAHMHALWVRPDGGVHADEVVTALRDAYRVAQFASKRLVGVTASRAEPPAPLLTLELPQRTALLRRVRAYVVACVFDAAMPLGMARLVASQLTSELEPELPLGHESSGEPSKRHVMVPSPPGAALVRTSEDGGDRPPHTLSFGASLPRRSRPPPPPAEVPRVSRLLTYLEAHAPEPHTVRCRLALRAGLTLRALDQPDALGPEAMVLIEAAVQDILGIDRAEPQEDRVTPFGHLVREVAPYGLLSLGDQLVSYQCHHGSIFLDQTVADALGGEAWAVRRQAAFEASHALLAAFYAEFGIIDPEERLELATELFAAMGHGRLVFDVTAEGGVVRGYELYYGASFRDKYDALVKNRRTLDTFAAGFVSAAASLAYPSDWGTLDADEVACVARRDELCIFALTRRPERPRFGAVVTRQLAEQLPRGGADSVPRPSPAAARAGADLGRMLHIALADEGGVIRTFGVRMALVPVSYDGQITFDTAHLVEKRSPEQSPLVGMLAREAAQMGAFHLLGGVLASPAWRAEHGPPAREVEVRLEQLVGLTRALGWGAFDVDELSPGRSLVITSHLTHESAYYGARHGGTSKSRLFFQQGLALALMHLLEAVDFEADAPIGPGTYDALFRGGARFDAKETRSPLRGDPVCEVTVQLAG